MTDTPDVSPTETLSYATRLAILLWEKHWREDAPHWEPLPDLLGVLTQIDNMVAGLVRENGHDKPATPDVSPAEIAWTRELWGGFMDDRLDVREVDDGWGGFGSLEARCRMPALFTTRARARLEYQDVRKVKLMELRGDKP